MIQALTHCAETLSSTEVEPLNYRFIASGCSCQCLTPSGWMFVGTLWEGRSCRAADSRGLARTQTFIVAWGETGAGPFWTCQVRDQGHEPDSDITVPEVFVFSSTLNILHHGIWVSLCQLLGANDPKYWITWKDTAKLAHLNLEQVPNKTTKTPTLLL